MSSSAGSHPSGPTRPRATNTCQECRRRKVRCDRKRPACTRCVELRPHQPCIYDLSDSRHRAYQFVPVGSSASSVLAPATSASRSSLSQGPGERAEDLLPDRLQLIEERLEQLNRTIQSLRDDQHSESPGPTPSVAVAADNSSMLEPLQEPSDQAIPASDIQSKPLGYLDVRSPGRTRYVSRAFWASMCDEISELQSLLRVHGVPASDVLFDGTNVLQGSELNAPTQRTVQDLTLPSKAKSDALFDAYIYNVHPVVPLVHVPSFRREYQRFWDSGPRFTDQIKLSSTPLILAALFAGAVACTDDVFESSFRDEDRDDFIDKLRETASFALRQSGFPRSPTVESLSAYMLVQGTLMTEEEPLSNCGFVGVVVRVAQMLGLNRDPSRFEMQLSALTAEVRRRVWWHAFYLDVIIALASGLPPLIVADSWEVREPSELSDEHIGTEIGREYEDTTRAGRRLPGDCHSPAALVCPMGIWVQGKMENAVMIRRLLEKSQNDRQMTLDGILAMQEDLLKHQQSMELRIARLPLAADMDALDRGISFNTWVKMMLSAMSDQHWWFLYVPVCSGTNSQAAGNIHTRIIEHSYKGLQKFMCLSACKIFERYTWAWPGCHQPLHLIMTLIREVERTGRGAASTQLCHLVDQALALCSPQGGLTGSFGEGIKSRILTAEGQEAWDVLMRQRTRTWIKAGTDSWILARYESKAIAEGMLGSIMDRIAGHSNSPANDNALLEEADPFGLNWQDWNSLYGTD